MVEAKHVHYHIPRYAIPHYYRYTKHCRLPVGYNQLDQPYFAEHGSRVAINKGAQGHGRVLFKVPEARDRLASGNKPCTNAHVLDATHMSRSNRMKGGPRART